MSTHKKIDVICIVSVILAIVLTVFLMVRKSAETAAVMSEGTVSDMFTANDLDADWDTAFATKIILSDEGIEINGNGAYINDGDVYIAYGGNYVLTGELSNGSVIVDADKSDKIWILLDGVKIHAEDDAAIRVEQADKVFLTLADGTENIVSSGGQYSEEAADAGVDGVIYSRDDLTINGNGSLTVNAEYKHGIVCNDDLVFTGGNITVSAVQDGVHANDSVCIRDAVFSISAGDDGITVSNDDETAFLYVESGTITISDCYEGLEAIEITIAGGTIDITPTDDGINANGSGGNSVIRITGGDIRIVNPTGRDADGLDSNGSIYVEGGNIFISVTGSGSNSAIDYGSENGGECIISGGTVIACGSSTMAEGFDAGSTQGFLMYSTSAQAGTTIYLADADGGEILSAEIPCSFSSVVLSAPELKVGDVCQLTIGDEEEQITIDNVSASGFAQTGMFGGGMRGGGGNRGGMFGFSENAGGQDAERADDEDADEGRGRFGGMEVPDDVEVPDGLEMPDGLEAPGGMEIPERLEMPEGMEAPEGLEMPDRMEMPDEMEAPDGMKPPVEGESSDKTEQSDAAEVPDGADVSESVEASGQADRLERGKNTGRQEMRENESGQLSSGAQQFQGNGMRFREQEQRGMSFVEGTAFSKSSAGAWILTGISVIILLIGLLVAVKIKH